MKQAGDVTYPTGGLAEDQDWKLPLCLAVGIHLAILSMAVIAPHLVQRRPMPEIHTVNLFSAVEAAAPVAKPQPRAQPPAARAVQPVPPEPPGEVKTMESEQAKKEVAPKPPPPPAQKPVSEKPVRSKTPDDEARLRDAQLQIRTEEAKRREEIARREMERALAAIRESYRDDYLPPPAPEAPRPAPMAQPSQAAAPADETGRTAAASGGEGIIAEGVLRQYLAALHSRIQQHWTLPDLQKWDDSLEAIMVVQVRRDGIVTRSFFERRSANFHFDQFVEKAIRDASPLPPFPPALREERLEIGLRFRPGGVGY